MADDGYLPQYDYAYNGTMITTAWASTHTMMVSTADFIGWPTNTEQGEGKMRPYMYVIVREEEGEDQRDEILDEGTILAEDHEDARLRVVKQHADMIDLDTDTIYLQGPFSG